jgi:GntR family transcriptional regulator
VKLLSFEYATPPPAIADALGLNNGERSQRSVRVRLVDGAPFSYLTTFVPERIGVTYSEGELATQPLLTLLERSGVDPHRATQSIGAALATPDVAAALDIEVGAPLIELTRVVFDRKGRGVEHLHAFYRPDRYNLRMDLARTSHDGQRAWSPIDRAAARSKEIKKPERLHPAG